MPLRLVLTLMILLVATRTPVYAQELNAGFVQGLWYKDDQVFADQTTRIYVAIRNHTGSDLTGTVQFYANGQLIEQTDVSALDGRIIESWTDWTPTYGEHTISATLSKLELHQVGTSTQTVQVVSASSSDRIFVDYDTDSDGVGNEADEDDDNDGISDEEERDNNTDPLDPDDPSDEPAADPQGDATTETTSNENDSVTTTSHQPAGLERFTNHPDINRTLSSFTGHITTLKKQLDTYRTTRHTTTEALSTPLPTAAIADPSVVTQLLTSSDSASSATLSAATPTPELTTPNETSEAEKGLLASLWNLTKTFFDKLYTLVLFLLSLYLGHPVIVQISLLCLLLFLVYRLAKKLGQRNQLPR